jgi:hypothetical protein
MAFNLYKKKDKKVILHTLSLSVIAVLSSISLSFTDLSSLNIAMIFTNSKSALAFTPVPGPVNTTAGLTLDTDKSAYVAGEFVVVDGRVDKVIPGEQVRLDFYDPAGKPIIVVDSSAEPNGDGFFSFTPSIPSNGKAGEYTLLATYNKQDVETKIMVRQSGSTTHQGGPFAQPME